MASALAYAADRPVGRFAASLRILHAAPLLAFLLAGCSNLYLHNPEREALTEKAKQQLSGIDLLSLTKQQVEILETYAEQEDAAVVEYGIQARDQRLLSMFRPDLAAMSSAEAMNAYETNGDSLVVKREWVRAELTQSTERRLRKLVCTTSDCSLDIQAILALSAPTNPKASQSPDILEDLRAAVADYASELRSAGELGEAASVKHCFDVSDEEVANWLAEHPEADADELASQGRNLESAEAEYYQSCTEYKALLAKDRALIAKALTGGDLKTALDDLSARKEAIGGIKRQEAELNGAMQELAAAIDDAQTDKIGAATDKVVGILEKAEDSAKGAGLEKLADVLDALIRGQADAAAAEAAGTSSDSSDDPELASLAALSRLFKSSATAAQTFAGKNPIQRLNGLLILRAGLQQKIDETRLSRGLMESQLRIVEAKVSAMESELYQLARTKAILDNVPPGSPLAVNDTLLQALSAYTLSWNRGRIPGYLASFKSAQVQRTYSVKLYQVTAKNYQALLEPAFTALDAYAKGGITPGDLAKALAVTLFLVKFATL